jgi:glutamate-1-semialdehyde 2,1-aminomutase
MRLELASASRSPNIRLDACLEQASAHFRLANPKSAAQHAKATLSMPGGSTRSSIFYAPFPLTVVTGKGAHVQSLDGTEYLDFLGEYTAGVYGHSNPIVADAIQHALQNGLALGGPSVLEEEYAALLRARFRSLELLRFTNSGTEANLLAVTTALEFTRRQAVLVFEGGYHGSVLSFSEHRTRNIPFEFLVVPYNDIERVQVIFRDRGDSIAAVLLEPMLGAGGCIPASAEFLMTLRDLSTQYGAVLIFDEVMTSRLSPGGLQDTFGVVPDLTTLGKYLGGGLSCGVFGGRAEIMKLFDLRRSDAIQHSGTFNNNVCSIAAGLAGLRDVFTPEANRRLNDRGNRLRQRLQSLLNESGLPMSVTGMGSMMNIHMCRGPITNYSDIGSADPKMRDLFHLDMLAGGIWSARRGMLNLSLPMTDDDCRSLVSAVDDFIADRCELFD